MLSVVAVRGCLAFFCFLVPNCQTDRDRVVLHGVLVFSVQSIHRLFNSLRGAHLSLDVDRVGKASLECG